MGHLLSILFQTLRRNLLLFTLIVLVLACAQWAKGQWTQVQAVAAEVPALRTALRDANSRQAALAQVVTGQVERASGATVQQLDAQIRALDLEIARLQAEDVPLAALVSGGSGAAVELLRRQAVRGAEIELRRQARAHLAALRAHAAVVSNRQAALARLAQLRRAHVQAYAAWQGAHAQLARLRADAGLLARIPFTPAYLQAHRLEQQVDRLRAANNRVHQEYLAQQARLNRLALPEAVAGFRVDEQRLAQAAAPLRERLARAEQLAADNQLARAYQAVRPVLPPALGVLIAWWLAPAAIRTLFYYVLAPLAARRPPIVLAPGSRPAHATLGGAVISAVSRTVALAPDEEMLVRPDYCQSQPAGVKITTAWLFDPRRWLTSIAARLWLLNRVRAEQGAEIVVSSLADPLDEVALVELAPGEALVLQPRALVGIRYRAGRRPRIRSHWRLGTLHAWLTLQLRYLAFEGPATLIVKGCRGVRRESAAAGRSVSQDATLGFTANAAYRTVRAQPFIAYLRGRQPLFQDAFSGADAYYLYEEAPRRAHAGRQPRNPLEALVDAGLKAFGI